jgi:alpha-L-fucosidase
VSNQAEPGVFDLTLPDGRCYELREQNHCTVNHSRVVFFDGGLEWLGLPKMFGYSLSIDGQTWSEMMAFEPTWESLRRRSPVPQWIRNAKFGIYFHWGVYSVPAYGNEHYYSHMHTYPVSKNGTHQRHLAIYGDLATFGYHDFIPQFTGERFDAEQWCDLFQKSGARFAGPVAEHHDGFSMWASRLTPFNAMDLGPKHDIVGEIAAGLRRRNMKFITTFHHELNYGYVTPEPEWAAADPKYAKLYGTPMKHDLWLAMWRDKLIEVIDSYAPDLIYHDSWLKQIPERYVLEYLAHYFNRAEERGAEVAVTYKNDDLPSDIGMEDIENRLISEPRERPFLVDLAIGTSEIYAWGYTEGMVLRTAEEVLFHLFDVVSKNGSMMLNISPMADGTIPADQTHVLHRIGLWLWSFGASIYETKPFSTFGESVVTESGEELEIRYTKSDRYLYAIVAYELPKRTKMRLSAVVPSALKETGSAGRVDTIELLYPRGPQDVTWTLNDDGLDITTPDRRIPSEMGSVYRIGLGS